MNAEKQNPANMITTTAAVIPSCHFERRVVASDLPFEVSAGDEYGLSIFESDNGNDHRVRTIDLPLQNHAQTGLRVHRIVMSQFSLMVKPKDESYHI